MKFENVLNVLLLTIIAAFIILDIRDSVNNDQLEEMQRLKEYCEAENPNKECILMFDYWAVDKHVE